MDTKTRLEAANDLLAPWASGTNSPEPDRLDIYVDAANLVNAVKALRQPSCGQPWGYLSAITGLDTSENPEESQPGALEALYHFCADSVVVTLRVKSPRQEAWVPSICDVIPSASLYERELSEMLGFTVINTPNPARLFLPDDWPDDLYPLRKDFNLNLLAQHDQSTRLTPAPESTVPATGKFIVPIGPQHPALKEPGHFEFAVDGETVVGASIRLGYVHRGLEKAAEERNWIQNLYLFERTCGICSHTHGLAYCLGVERLAQVEVPPRAQAIREIGAGLERIHSHLLWLGVAAHEAGFDTLFMYSWRDREIIMDLLESISGNRVNYSFNVLGGVKVDLGKEHADALRKGLETLDERTRHYLDIVTRDAAFLQRTRGVGEMSLTQAEDWQVVGPTARASGLVRDIRVEAPYGAYRQFPVSLVTETDGDLEARFVVRLKEVLVSIQTIRTILDNLPSGELTARMPRRLPAGETISRVEAPRGELLYFIKSSGGEKPDRVHARTPSICNFGSVLQLVIGHQLADVPLILAGIDPCFSCNDR